QMFWNVARDGKLSRSEFMRTAGAAAVMAGAPLRVAASQSDPPPSHTRHAGGTHSWSLSGSTATLTGAGGAVMAATMTWLGSSFTPWRKWAYSETGVMYGESSSGLQLSRGPMDRSSEGSHTVPNSKQRKDEYSPSCESRASSASPPKMSLLEAEQSS